MSSPTLIQVKKKIRRLEKAYESTPDAAILAKAKIEKQIRKWINLEREMKGYK